MTDERAGLPSASGMERLKLCPGSWALEQQCPEPPETEEAASGTRIHDAWAGKLTEWELTADDMETLDAIKRLELEAVMTVFGVWKDAALREHRQWFFLNGTPTFSGKPDGVYCVGTDLLILDAKTGRNETDIAADNAQLRALAVLWDDRNLYQVNSITVGILAPWQSQRITLARYERHHLDAARQEVLDIIAASKKPDAPRNPSLEACRYCKAKAVCKEAREAGLNLPVAETPELPTATRTPEAFAAALTRYELSACLHRGKLFEKVHEAIRSEAKRRLEAGEEVPGWQLKPGRVTEKVTDAKLVVERYQTVTGADDIWSAVGITKTALKELVRKHTGTKGKGLDAQMAALLAGATETKQAGSQLEEI